MATTKSGLALDLEAFWMPFTSAPGREATKIMSLPEDERSFLPAA